MRDDGAASIVATAPHEFAANFVFDRHGLSPHFAADRRVKDGDGSQVGEFSADGERWVAKLYYQSSNIVSPGERTPQGTEFGIEEMREHRIAVSRHPDEDETGEQSFNAHIAPRWQGMEVEKSDGTVFDLSVPDSLIEGVNVRVSGSNIEFSRYRGLLQDAADAVGINPWYFAEPNDLSNVQDAERYVRIRREKSGPIHARAGPIVSMAHLLENDQCGYRKLVQNDTDGHGRDLPGHYHTVTLGPKRIRAAFPNHDLPKEIKHYYAREARSVARDSPLRDPKLGASYQASCWDETLGATDDDLEQLSRELDETVYAVLADAGLSLRPDAEIYRPDAYFAIDEYGGADREIIDLDLPSIRSSQESVVVRHLADGFSPVEWDAISTLVTDGGQVSPQHIADENDRHVGSVYRALRRIPDLVETEYGSVKLRSNHIAELVYDAVETARDATREALEAGARAIEAAERGADEDTAALMTWAAARGIDVDDSGEARLVLRADDLADWPTDKRARKMKELYRLWTESGRSAIRFREGVVRFGKKGLMPVWRLL